MPPLTLETIRENAERLAPWILRTPVWTWSDDRLASVLEPDTEVVLKLELFQRTGTFKLRGALTNLQALEPDALALGVTAVSAGNHAIAVSYAARLMETTAAVVMPTTANPARVERCRELGARIELVEFAELFEKVKQIERDEGRAFVHPFEGPQTVLGTATLGLELSDQAPDLDAVIVPIGGGGLCAGVATAVKLANPECRVFGVEPEGADSMHRSFAAGEPVAIDEVRTIADSLGAPYALPYSFELCREHVDELAMVDDAEIRVAMFRTFEGAKLAVEPAGATALAALCGPLRERLAGQRVGLVICGANTDIETFAEQVRAGAADA